MKVTHVVYQFHEAKPPAHPTQVTSRRLEALCTLLWGGSLGLAYLKPQSHIVLVGEHFHQTSTPFAFFDPGFYFFLQLLASFLPINHSFPLLIRSSSRGDSFPRYQMSWQISLYIGILYFCLGLVVLNTGVFNSELSPAATVTTSISTLILQPIPTGLVAGYLPYKPSALPRFDDIGTSQTEDSKQKERYRQQGDDANVQARSTGADDLSDCQAGKKSCRSLGHSVCPHYLR